MLQSVLSKSTASRLLPALAIALAGFHAQPALSGPQPVDLGASYTISFNGFNIGGMRLETHVGATEYRASSDVEISALLGAFRWKGVTRVEGAMAGGKLRPSGYAFDFESTANAGAVRIGFDKGAVVNLTNYPTPVDPPDFVPLTSSHVKAVLDPLSAVIAMTRPDRGQPCGRKVAIFDGRQRLDIRLAPARTETLDLGQGRSATGTVCSIRYTPVGGYRDNSETRSMAENEGIEVAFRSMGGTGVFAPYRITLPTMAGTISIDATRFDLAAPGGPEVALVE